MVKAALLLDYKSGRGRKRLFARLPEHEAVEDRFLTNAPREPLEGWKNAVDDLVRWGLHMFSSFELASSEGNQVHESVANGLRSIETCLTGAHLAPEKLAILGRFWF